MNIEEIAKTLEFEVEDVMMLIDMFIDNAKESLAFSQAAQESNNFKELKNAAHAIKGSAANLMLDDIATLAQEIEQYATKEVVIDYKELFTHLELKIGALEEIKAEA